MTTKPLCEKKGFSCPGVVRAVVDQYGRCIPANGIRGDVCAPSGMHGLNEPVIDFEKKLQRLAKFLPVGLRLGTAGNFEQRTEELLSQIGNDATIANLLKGIWCPVLFPRMEIDDYGRVMEDVFLFAAVKSLWEKFPRMAFENNRRGEFSGKVKIVEGSRHYKLLEKMKEGPVVGIQFFPMAGFSIQASREMMALLPASLLLSGGIDILTATAIMYPEMMEDARRTPGLLVSANSHQSGIYSLYLRAGDEGFRFRSTHALADANSDYTSGLLYIGH